MSRFLIAITLLGASLHSAYADDAKVVYANAKAKYGAGEYAAAAKLFAHAYELEPDPAYLFNVAQSYRLADDCTHAVEYYKKFLDKVPNPPNLEAVHGWQADAEKCVKDRALATPPPKDPPPPKNPPTEPPKDPPKPPPVASRPSAIPAIASFGVAAIGFGIGAFYTSRVFSIKSDREDVSRLPGCPRVIGNDMLCDGVEVTKKTDQLDDKGHAAQTREIVGYAVGAAAVGAGVFFLLRRGHAESPVAVAPTKGGAMVSTGFSF